MRTMVVHTEKLQELSDHALAQLADRVQAEQEHQRQEQRVRDRPYLQASARQLLKQGLSVGQVCRGMISPGMRSPNGNRRTRVVEDLVRKPMLKLVD